MRKLILIIGLLHFVAVDSTGQDRFKSGGLGQLSGWGIYNFGDAEMLQIGSRFIPAINLECMLDSISTFDAEISFNTIGTRFYENWKFKGNYESFNPYRFWLRYSARRIELRAGLQKINFGSAAMLRPLMWFDQIDPRDPLQLTNGVYALLGRYYFKNNSNFWLWTLYGNDQPKGWDFVSSVEDRPELGGRFQFPVPKGEAAVSFHSRMANLNSFIPDSLLNGQVNYPENRIGLDGKWDLGLGLWFEYMFLHNRITEPPWPKNFQHALNLGTDYTFGIGKGLHLLTEFFWYAASDEGFDKLEGVEFTALTINYPLSIMDNISAILFYDLENNKWYRFVNYQRSYDNWILYLMAFWNPDTFGLYNMNTENNLFAGKGLQLMCVYNF